MTNNIKAGADIHAGDGGYSEGTQEKYDEFVKGRNQSLGKMRIRELAEQCWSHRVDGTLIDGQLHFDEQKFADLLIRECQIALSPMLRDMISRGQAYNLIKEHFGVE